MEMIAELRGVTQRVAQQAKFDACVSKVEAHIAKLSEENDKLAALAFGSDVVLESKDGTKVPAIKQTLIESSDVFSGMFSEHTAEGRDGIVRTDAGAEALRYVSRCVHTSLGAASANTDTLLEVCELAERWNLTAVLRTAAAAFGDRLDSSTALKTLASADRHMQAGSGSDVWKDILEDAAKAVASGMPDVAEGAEFKTLSIEAVAHVMSHLQEATFELPALEGGMESNEYGDWSEPVSWPKDSPSANLPSQGIQTRAGGGAATPAMVPPPPVSGQQFGLHSTVSGGVVGFFVRAQSGSPTLARATIELTKPGGPPGGLNTVRPWQREIGSWLFRAGYGRGYSRVVTEDTAARYTTDGRFRVSGRVTITKEQRQSEVFNLWLLASGAVEAPLTPLAQLQCLRTCACGFDFNVADTATLTAKLAERDLSTEGQPRTLQTRLRDAMFAQLSLSPALHQVSSALATLGACHFKPAAEDGSLFELDAAAMSQVLAHEWLCAGSEKDVLEHVLRWASYAGRTAEVVDSVMPLVRFPLVSMIKPPAKLKELKQRSAVVAELVAEAVKHQVGSTSGSWTLLPAKKHALLPSMPADTEQLRTKRRRFCKKDEIPKVDAATAVLELAF